MQAQDQPDNQEYTLNFNSKETQNNNEENDFVADFDKANFEEDCKPNEKSSFEELQKASKDLEKRLHERIVKSAESKFKDQAREGRQRQGANVQNNRWEKLMRFVDENTKGEVKGFKFYINVCTFSYHNIINQICKNRIYFHLCT